MTYAHIQNSVIDFEGDLPHAATLQTGEWVSGLHNAAIAVQQDCGYYQVVNVTRPADTPTTTYVRSLVFSAGVVTETWTVRNWTTEELATKAAATALQLKRSNLVVSIATLRSWALTADAAVVTSGNAVATLGTVLKNLSDFYDGFADFLEIQLL